MNKLFILLGPTASGKSDLSMKLAKDFPFEIINADLYSIYRGLDIGTAKPSKRDMEITKHYLVDNIDPNMKYNVAMFCSDVSHCINTIYTRNKIPLIVGGSMMYVHQLINGLTHEYSISESDRKVISYIQEVYTGQTIFNSLQGDRTILLENINPNDSYRIEKLLERLISPQNIKKQYKGLKKMCDLKIYTIFIDVQDRDCLRDNILKRTQRMIQQGLIKEVQNLIVRYNLTRDTQSMKAIGYKETFDYLEDKVDFNELTNTISLSTRQLAKRQLTWKNKFEINLNLSYPNIDYSNVSKFISESL